MQHTAKSASFALALAELRDQMRRVFEQDGSLSQEEEQLLNAMTDLYAETEALDVIRIGAMSVLERGEPSARFPRRVKELIRDLEGLIPEGDASVSA